MKKHRTVFVSLVATVLGLSAGMGLAQKRQDTTNAMMRLKLNYAAAVLEGVTLGKYDMVVTNAVPLRNMNLTNTFLTLGTPGYDRAITNFQTTVDGILKAATEKDQVKMTDRYNEMIRDCVQCHKQFRREQVVPSIK